MSGRKSKDRYVLDTYAALTYMKEESGWQKVQNILLEASVKKIILYMSYVNLGEFYYIVYKEYGAVEADRALNLIKLWPLQFVSIKEDVAIIAGRMKAENRISYADAFVVATALAKRAAVVTGDLEFKCLEEILEIVWLPKNR